MPSNQSLKNPIAIREFTALTVPVHRASTLVFDNTADFLARKSQLFDGFSYGLYGTPTTRALEENIAAVEGGNRTVVVPSGLAALTHPMLALLSAGDHILVADCVYGPTREFCNSVLKKMGITASYFAADAASISDLLQNNTRLVVLESPGSFTMQIQEISTICSEAHAAGALVMLDNAWGFGNTNMFDHGVDIVSTALSKYASGHSDVCMGSITVRSESLYRQIKTFVTGIGAGVASDDAFLVLRGLRTLSIRLAEHAVRGLQLTEWLRGRPEVSAVINPAHPDDRQYVRFSRYFKAGNGLVTVILHNQELARISAMLDGLTHFRIGASWGGTDSLIAIADLASTRSVQPWPQGRYAVRLHIGLEPLELLYADLEAGFTRLSEQQQ
jgi:cystathionine beta-lyase